jgi:Enhancer of rudimentary
VTVENIIFSKMSNGKHTILLIQAGKKQGSRTFHDYEAVSDAMNGLCKLFEAALQRQFPNKRSITYDITDLLNYIDGLGDACALVFDPEVAAYRPHNREWIKKRVVAHLKSVAGRN